MICNKCSREKRCIERGVVGYSWCSMFKEKKMEKCEDCKYCRVSGDEWCKVNDEALLHCLKHSAHKCGSTAYFHRGDSCNDFEPEEKLIDLPCKKMSIESLKQIIKENEE